MRDNQKKHDNELVRRYLERKYGSLDKAGDAYTEQLAHWAWEYICGDMDAYDLLLRLDLERGEALENEREFEEGSL